MNKSIFLFPIFISLLCILSNVYGGFSETMKERLQQIIEAKDEGKVGEGTDGYLHARPKSNDFIRNLVSDENSDRQDLFLFLSKKTGGSIEEVAMNFSRAMVKRGKKGHWYKNSSGSWVQK